MGGGNARSTPIPHVRPLLGSDNGVWAKPSPINMTTNIHKELLTASAACDTAQKAFEDPSGNIDIMK